MYEYKRRVTREWHFWLNNSRAFTGRYALLSAVFCFSVLLARIFEFTKTFELFLAAYDSWRT